MLNINRRLKNPRYIGVCQKSDAVSVSSAGGCAKKVEYYLPQNFNTHKVKHRTD